MSEGVNVRLPPVLRTVMGGSSVVRGRGSSVDSVLKSIAISHPALGLHLFDESGNPRRNIVCLHRGVLVRANEFGRHDVSPGDELVLTNALAGG